MQQLRRLIFEMIVSDLYRDDRKTSYIRTDRKRPRERFSNLAIAHSLVTKIFG